MEPVNPFIIKQCSSVCFTFEVSTFSKNIYKFQIRSVGTKNINFAFVQKTKPLNMKGNTKFLLQQWLKLWKFQRLGFSTKFQNQGMKECVFSMNPGESSESLMK